MPNDNDRFGSELPEPLPEVLSIVQKSEGCIGVNSAWTTSGKACLFVWFQDRSSAITWYRSDAHLGVIRRYFPDFRPKTPLEHAPADLPLLIIASFTPKNNSPLSPEPFPFSQASIEYATPVFGGASFGGTFSPPGLEITRPCKLELWISRLCRWFCRLAGRSSQSEPAGTDPFIH